MSKRPKKSNTGVIVGVTLGGLVIAGGIAAVALMGDDTPALAGYQILPNCQGLVVLDEAKALESVRAAARVATDFNGLMNTILGKCGFAATTTPAFAPSGRFVFLAIRAALSELVKKGYSELDAALRITEAASNLAKMGANLGDLPKGLEP